MKKKLKHPPLDMEELIPLLIKVWRNNLHLPGPADCLQTREFRAACSCIKEMYEFLHGNSATTTLEFFQDTGFAAAYLLYFWPVHYSQALSLMGELPKPPKKVLDLFSGPGPLAFAACKWGAESVTCIDEHEFPLKLAAEVAARSGYALSVRQARFPNLSCVKGEKYDLITVGYAMKELSSQGVSFSKLFNTLLPFLSEDGAILFIDSSFDATCKKLLSLRDYCQESDIPIVAPCVWRGKCPALASKSWLCYAQRPFEKPHLLKELQRGAGINLNSLKMSYLIVQNPKKGFLHPKQEAFRVVSPLMKEPSPSCWLCGTCGKKQLCGSDTPPNSAKAFSFLQRGELISVENAKERGNVLEVVEGTTIKIEAALGKPVPKSYLGEEEEN